VAPAYGADGGDTPLVVDTLGGRMQVRWDRGAAATAHGQLVFFAEFLAATGVFESWVSACTLEYRSGNAPDKRDVLGTLKLGLLAGHRRHAHITALRGDAVAAQALGLNKVVSEDALRRGLERIDESISVAWMRPALMRSVREALGQLWVLDIDASIKPTAKAAKWWRNTWTAANSNWIWPAPACMRVSGVREYAVTVTDVNDPIEAVAQWYRDRTDCRTGQLSGFDELKNQWGRARTRSVLRTGRA